MIRITLRELQACPDGTLFCRMDDKGDPVAPLFSWRAFDGQHNDMFGYAAALFPEHFDGGGGFETNKGWEAPSNLSMLPTRFYYRENSMEAEPDMAFYRLTEREIEVLKALANGEIPS